MQILRERHCLWKLPVDVETGHKENNEIKRQNLRLQNRKLRRKQSYTQIGEKVGNPL